MYRYLAICIFSLFYALSAQADYNGALCTYSEINTTTHIFTDPVLAPIGTTIGTVTFDLVSPFCKKTQGQPIFAYQVRLAPQQFVPGKTNFCKTSVEGIALEDLSKTCHYVADGVGPSMVTFNTPSNQVQVRSKTFNYVKLGVVKPGVNALLPGNPKLIEYIRSGGGGLSVYGLKYAMTPGDIIGTSCTLVNSNVLVDFGSVYSAGLSKPFQIEFGNCADQVDALAYNAAVSLRLLAERKSTDGSALLNNLCKGCSNNLQIALTDGAGTPINLSKSYKLSSNKTIDVGQRGLVYNFNAQLQDVPGQTATPGIIDAQLVFETVVE